MPVKVLLADDAKIVRAAIRDLLTDSPDIVELVGEAADFPQTIKMANDLKPQVIVMDLHIARANKPDVVKDCFSGSTLLAISIANDEEANGLAKSYGAVQLLDKMKLCDELVPAIVRAAFPLDQAANA